MDEGLARLDRTEPAGTGADIAEDHDRGGPLAPAFAHVGAVSLLADRIEIQAVEETPEVLVGLAGGDAGLDPLRVTARRGRTVCGQPRGRRASGCPGCPCRRVYDVAPPHAFRRSIVATAVADTGLERPSVEAEFPDRLRARYPVGNSA